MKKKAGIFVDVQNIYYTCRKGFSRNFDYNAFWRTVESEFDIQCAYAYATYRGDEKQTQFQNILRAIGFDVRLKPFIQRQDGSAKGDWDVGITLDVVEKGKELDEIILLSGDGDFALLLSHMRQQYGVKSTVYGVETLTANTLKQSADRFIEINASCLL